MYRTTRHTPPNTPNNMISQTHSEPDISSVGATSEHENINIAARHKRARMENSPGSELRDFKLELKEEIKQMLLSWKNDQETSFTKIITDQNVILSKLVAEISDLKLQNTQIQKTNLEIEKSMSFISQQYEEMKDYIITLQKERKDQKEYIENLESKVRDLQLASRSSSVEVRNIPPKENETMIDLTNVISKLGAALDLPIPSSTIRDIHRLPGKPGMNRSIIAEFTSVDMKNSLLATARRYNLRHEKECKLNTELIGLPGERRPVYIAEHLPPTAKKLFYLAREFAKQQGYQFCWSSSGNIFLRKEHGAKHILVKSEKHLLELRQQQQ